MIKNAIILFLIFAGFIFPQGESQNPNVELPDFVITGSDDISIRPVEKSKPDFIPTITREFLKPTFKPDDLELAELSNPIEGDMRLLDSVDYYNGILSLELGRYTAPAGEINYAFPFERGMLHGIVTGTNQLEYVENSDRVNYSGELDFNYSLAADNEVLPGTKFSLNGMHTVNKYKLFGSVSPDTKRTLNAGTAGLGIQSLYGKKFIFDFRFGGDFTYLDTDNFNESVLKTKFFGKYNAGDVGFSFKADYRNQNLTSNLPGDNNSDYYFLRPAVSFKLFNRFLAEAGFTFSGSDDEYLHDIYASLSSEVSQNIVVLAEYSPMGEYITTGKFLRDNFYFDPQPYSRIFVKKKNLVNITFVYEYDKYFQVDGGLRYFRTDNIQYYDDPDTTGIFKIASSDAKQFTLFTNLLFHLGPYGIFYGSFELLDLNNSEGNRIPYQPVVKGSLTYGYPFSPAVMAKIKFEHLSKRYTDIENINSLNGIYNLGFLVEYKFKKSLLLYVGLDNILGNKIYYWDGYREKPFEISLGASLLFN